MFSQLPKRTDINVFDSLDERAAEKRFFGKDLKEAEALFRDNLSAYAEDLMWMGPIAFCFYVDAAIAYLVDPQADPCDDDLGPFCGAVEFHVDHHLQSITPAKRRLLTAVQAIRRLIEDRRHEFGGSDYLETRYRELEKRLSA